MARYDSDDEQLEAIRNWLKENGKAMAAGAVIAIAGVIGWQQWGAHQERSAEAASIAYMQLIDARETGADPDTVERRGRAVMEDYQRSVYGSMAGLQLAEYQVERSSLEQAANALRWVVDNGVDESFRHVARLRLAQVLLGMDEPEQALAVLDVPDHGVYAVQYLEKRGDAYVASGDYRRARQAYDDALATDGISSTRRALIRIKRDDLVADGTSA